MIPPTPPDADKIGAALRAQRFHMLEDIAKELAGELVFPTYFDAAFHLRDALQDPDISIGRIVDIVQLEPLIAAKLLHMANSVMYNPNGMAAKDLGAAITRLGLATVRTTALAIAVSQLMRSKEILPFKEQARMLWDHSLQTAVAARLLARRQTRLNPEEALLAGLVHDLGAFYMLYRAAQYEELRTRPESVKYLIVQWHESIGVSLLQALGLPDEIVEATIDHDQPRSVPDQLRTLNDVIYAANVLAGEHFEWIYQDVDPNAGEPALIRQRFADLADQIAQETREMQASFA